MGYELLENDLTDSTLWMYRSLPAKVLAITILSKCFGSDRVYVPPAILIDRARLTPEQGAAALAELGAPDPNSKCSLEEGRFIVEKMDENGNRYLWLPSYKGRRMKYLARERKRLQRERDDGMSRSVTPSHATSQPVTSGHDVTPGHKMSPVEQISEPDIRTRAEQKGERARFAPPTLGEVQDYGKEIPGLDAAAFHDFYVSKGWKVGSQPMKDWKAAARNWRRRDAETGKVSIPKPKREDDLHLKRLAEVLAEDAETAKIRKDRGIDP